MYKKPLFPVIILFLFATTFCIKETYDMNKLSVKMKYSPTLAMSAASGEMTLLNIVEPNDTIIFENDNFIKLLFREDSIIDLKLEDYYDLNDMVSFNRDYEVGSIEIDNFTGTIPVGLNVISQAVSPAFHSSLLLMDDGSPHDFPSFGLTDVGEFSFPAFTSFENAVFSSGTLDISVKNNLTIPLYDIKINLFNSAGHIQIGTELTIPAMYPGETSSTTLDLTGESLTNSIIASVVILGSDGASNVIIDMDDNIEVGIMGYDLSVSSGTVIIPEQILNSLDNNDTIDFDPGDDIEIEKLRVTSGSIGYNLVNNSSLSASVNLELPTSIRVSSPVSESFDIPASSSINGDISVDDTELDLSTDPDQKYNRVPVMYSVTVSSNGMLVVFNSTDFVHIELNMLNPEMDYVKGYFGQLEETVDPDTLDTGLDEILDHITGQFHISSPAITMNYTNSFGIPIGVTLNAEGRRGTQTEVLGLAPFVIEHPVSLDIREVSSSFSITKDNSDLPDLISLPPEEITYSASGKMNPEGFSGIRDNYVFGDSRFVASLEIEVPMEFWINNLQLTDTIDNFLKLEDEEGPFNPEDMDLFRLDFTVNNGFPLGASLGMMLYDSANHVVRKTVEASDRIQEALVDATGKVTTAVESTISIEFDKEFFEASKESDKIILVFTLNTTGSGTQDVKIYADYSISFKASLVIKPNLEL